jgi:predicted ATPase
MVNFWSPCGDVSAIFASSNHDVVSTSGVLPQWVYRRTDGNPPFLRSMVEHLVTQGILVDEARRWELRTPLADSDIGVLESLRPMLAQQRDHLTPEERQIIEAASVRGMEFSAGALAVGLEANAAAVETCCDELVRRGLVLREQWAISRRSMGR